MRTVNIFDDENSVVIEDDFDITNFTFYPKEKRFEVSQSIKDDCFFNNSIIEYKISQNPLELWMRTLECYSEPPIEYSIKDGVVLESELRKKSFLSGRLKTLEKKLNGRKFQYSITMKSIFTFFLSIQKLFRRRIIENFFANQSSS